MLTKAGEAIMSNKKIFDGTVAGFSKKQAITEAMKPGRDTITITADDLLNTDAANDIATRKAIVSITNIHDLDDKDKKRLQNLLETGILTKCDGTTTLDLSASDFWLPENIPHPPVTPNVP
jgi:hypothetical protein